MSIRRDEFAVEINYKDGSYTPKQVLEYIKSISGEGFANLEKIQALKRESLARAKELMKQYKLEDEQPLTKTGSPSGKDLAELVLQHCDSTIRLIVKGGHERGVLI